MKRCPFCAEEIQDQAIKCKHCGEFLNRKINPTVEPPTIENQKPVSYKPLGIMCLILFMTIGRNISKHFSHYLFNTWLYQDGTLESASRYATYSAIATSFLVFLFAFGGWIIGKNIIKYINEKITLPRGQKVLVAWACAVAIMIGSIFISGMTVPTKYRSTGYHMDEPEKGICFGSMGPEESKKIINDRANEILKSSMNAIKRKSAVQVSDPNYIGTFTPDELKAKMGLARQIAKEEIENNFRSGILWKALLP